MKLSEREKEEILKDIILYRHGKILFTLNDKDLLRVIVKCKEGHEFMTHYGALFRGYWCSFCDEKQMKKLG